MRIMNCTGQPIQVTAYRNRFRDAPWRKAVAIPNNGDWEHNMKSDGIELLVKYQKTGDIEDSRWGWNPVSLFAAQHPNPDFPNTTLVVITSHPGHRMVDWKKATASYRKKTRAIVGGDASNSSVQAGLDAGAAIISALGTGVAALGAPGALPAGAIMGVGHILLMVIGGGDRSLPPPPDSAEIESIVTKVVKRELDIQDAEKAATAFAVSTAEFLRVCHSLQNRIPGGLNTTDPGISAHQQEDVERMIHNALDLGGEGTLSFSVHHMLGHPEIAKWILPELVGGLATFLTARRLHILMAGSSVNGSGDIQVTVKDVADYAAEVGQFRKGLKAVYDAAEEYVAHKTESVGLQKTLQENAFKVLVRKSMYGIGDLTPVVTAIHELEMMENALNADVEAGSTEHFWKIQPPSRPEAPPLTAS